jgi:hypothetical protein
MAVYETELLGEIKMNKPLPIEVKRTLVQFKKFIKAIHPNATDIECIDTLVSTSGYRKTVQYNVNGKKCIAMINALSDDEYIGIEYPYNPILWQYNK